MIDDSSTLPVRIDNRRRRALDPRPARRHPRRRNLAAKQKSPRTRRAYRLDVQHFMRTLAITAPEELRQADHKAVIAWERYMRETEHAASSTIRRRLAALSSLYKHLVRHDHAARNPVGEVERPAINRDEGSTLAFAKAQARKLLDLPAENTVAGLRDRAILSVGLQVGLRRAEIAALKVGDLHQNRGYDSLRSCARAEGATRWRSTRRPPRACAPIWSPPATRPISTGPVPAAAAQRQAPGRTPAWTPTRSTAWCGNTPAALGLDRGYSAHSMRATFITTALENGAQLEDVQKAAGHRDPSTTKLYDRRGYNPEKAASFFATY